MVTSDPTTTTPPSLFGGSSWVVSRPSLNHARAAHFLPSHSAAFSEHFLGRRDFIASKWLQQREVRFEKEVIFSEKGLQTQAELMCANLNLATMTSTFIYNPASLFSGSIGSS